MRPVYEAIFGDFGVAGTAFARRQRVEHARIGEHHLRLMKDAQEVLAMAGIDPGLAAHRGIDLSQQRGRYLHEIHAAPNDASGKAGKISDDASAECNHRIAPLKARGKDLIDHFLQGVKALCLFSRRQNDWLKTESARSEAGGKGIEVRSRDIPIADHGRSYARHALADFLPGAGKQAGPDSDLIGARAQPNLYRDGIGGHCASLPSPASPPPSALARASITSAAMTSLRSSRVDTVTSALA